MELDFWHERWTKREIGFHQHDFNKHMQTFMDRLQVRDGGNILVPLCGKSLDMIWLLERGYQVTGIEISALAVEEFFAENKLSFSVTALSGANFYSSKNLNIYCADFFVLELSQTTHIDAVYDRASLIALPKEMRSTYVEQLTSLIPGGTRSLLVTLDYPQEQMHGPPFSVTPAEVEVLFGDRYEIENIHSEDCLSDQPHFKRKGLTRLEEHIFLLQKL